MCLKPELYFCRMYFGSYFSYSTYLLTLLYYTILYYTILYYTILYYAILLGDIQKILSLEFPNEKLGAEKREKNLFSKLSKKDQCFLQRYYICNDKNIYKFIKKR